MIVKLSSNGWQYEHDGATYYGGSDAPIPRRQLRHEARQQVAVVTGRQDTVIRWDMTPLEREGRDSGDLLGR